MAFRLAPALARAGICSFAASVTCWALFVISPLWRFGDLNALAAKIQDGEKFNAHIIQAARPSLLIAQNDSTNAAILRSVALLEVRRAEMALEERDVGARREQFTSAERAVRTALRFNPSDGFLWYALFWLDKTSHGFRPAAIDFIRLSYATAEHEGWVAVHRNRDALAVLDQLPTDLQTKVLVEFRNLVAANFTDDAASILAGPGWSQRKRLLAVLEDVPDNQKLAFAQRLAWRGLNLTIPGLHQAPVRPFEFAPG